SLPPGHVPRERALARCADWFVSLQRSTPPCAAFFGLERAAAARLVTLKPGVFVQPGPGRIYNGLLVRDFLVMRLTRIGLAQIAHPFGSGVGHHDILVTMHFFLATVMQGLFFRVLGPLATTLCAINDELP